jgi:5-formyltetrahydrofolate cyclo-ligase
MNNSDPALDKRTLRAQLRQQRRGLSSRDQRLAAEHLADVLGCHPIFMRARHLAFYLANDGEIDPERLMALAHSADKHIYLPTLHPFSKDSMVFVPWQPGAKLTPNRFGIGEPRWQRPIRPWLLDVVFLPLVAFDHNGNRLGMGGGFYDRTFEKRQRKPRLIGLAHHFQECDQLSREPWDVPLDGIATDTGIRLFRQ